MKTDDLFDQKGEIIESRDGSILEGVREIAIIRENDLYKVRISIGDSMYFDSPSTNHLTVLHSIVTNLKNRLR